MTNSPATIKKILDVGCGWNKTPGAIGIDSNPKAHADIVHDLGVVPYPIESDAFDEVVCSHVVEHVPDLLALMTELYRITRPGGRIRIVAPHYSNPDWATDPTHRNHLNSYTFNCFIEERQLFPFYTEVKFKPIQIYVSLANLWRALGIEWLVNLDQHWPAMRFTRKFWEFYLCNVIRGKELRFELEVSKAA